MTDTERLDWLESVRGRVNTIEGPGGFTSNEWRIWGDEEDAGFPGGHGATLRNTIDDAMAKGAK